MTTETQTNTQTTETDATATAADAAGETTALGTAATTTAEDDASKTGDEGKVKEGEDGKTADADKGKDGEADKSKDGEDDKGGEGAPEAYDVEAFKSGLPEGMEFDQEAFDAVEPVLRELNLSQEEAGKVLGGYAEKVLPVLEKRAIEKFNNDGAELRATMARELQGDPEVGGKNLEESRAYAAKAIAHFLPNEEDRATFSKFMDESGFGNDRFLMRIIAGSGRTLGEATTPGGGGTTEKSTAQKFYGDRKGT